MVFRFSASDQNGHSPTPPLAQTLAAFSRSRLNLLYESAKVHHFAVSKTAVPAHLRPIFPSEPAENLHDKILVLYSERLKSSATVKEARGEVYFEIASQRLDFKAAAIRKEWERIRAEEERQRQELERQRIEQERLRRIDAARWRHIF